MNRKPDTFAIIFWTVFALLLLDNCWAMVHLQVRKGRYFEPFGRFFEAADWVKANVAPDVVVASRKPSLFQVVSGNPSVGYTWGPPDSVLAGFDRDSVQAVIVDQLGFGSTARYLAPAINARPGLFRVIWQSEEPVTWVVRYFPDGVP